MRILIMVNSISSADNDSLFLRRKEFFSIGEMTYVFYLMNRCIQNYFQYYFVG